MVIECKRDCNACVSNGHVAHRLAYRILARLHRQFGTEVYNIVQSMCPHMTVCPECRVDDFVHVIGCSTAKDLNSWEKHQENAE